MISRTPVIPAALLLAASFSPAFARPRDDVMAGAYRCASIANSRQWLDCYYGVAQPVRAALALPPVPAQQSALAAQPPAGGAPQDVELRDAVLAEASRCYTLAGDREWLNCYYAAAQPVRASLGLLSTAPQPPAGTFGLPQKPVMTREASGVRSAMAEYKFDSFGKFTVRLADGQVWRQLASDTTLAHWMKPAGEYVVDVKKGAFNSFNLTVEHVGGSYKVQRLQ
ncbi:MAG TPA: hypothetical protein VHY57_02660 [Rhizomicrobium sp.]|nr:hypothetical protein [Rhizomicrobium sp.]